MCKKCEVILDTRYSSYVSKDDVEEEEEPKLYQTVKGQKVLKNITKYYAKVQMPTVTQSDVTTQRTLKAGQSIPNIKHVIFINIMKFIVDYNKALSILKKI